MGKLSMSVKQQTYAGFPGDPMEKTVNPVILTTIICLLCPVILTTIICLLCVKIKKEEKVQHKEKYSKVFGKPASNY